jgi:23S rRNA pseudouridine2605 synthase
MEPIRIQKVLSDHGVASRRKAEELIRKGEVTVNGHPAELGQKVDPAKDIIAVGGERVQINLRRQNLYIMLHKPRGFVTTMQDEMAAAVPPTCCATPRAGLPHRRFDRGSEGLLLCTNDATCQLYHASAVTTSPRPTA